MVVALVFFQKDVGRLIKEAEIVTSYSVVVIIDCNKYDIPTENLAVNDKKHKLDDKNNKARQKQDRDKKVLLLKTREQQNIDTKNIFGCCATCQNNKGEWYY